MAQAKLDELQETIDRRRAGDAEGALVIVKTDRGKLVMDKIRQQIDAMISTEETQLVLRTAEWNETVTRSTYVMIAGSGVLVASLLLIGFFASRDYRAVESEAWSRRVQLSLGTQMQGDLAIDSLGTKLLRVLVDNLDARVGAVFITEPGGRLRRRIAAHALEAGAASQAVLEPGDGPHRPSREGSALSNA